MITKHMLETLKTGRHPATESLPHLINIAGIQAAGTRKDAMVQALYDFYNNEDNLLRFWNRLHGLDKELLEQYVRGSGWIEWDEIEQIFEKYGQQANRFSSYSWEGLAALLPAQSPARIFFLGRRIPDTLMSWLRKHIPTLPVSYNPVTDEEATTGAELILAFGDTSHQQFVRMIRAVGQSKLKTTSSGLPTKAATVKFQEALQHIEPLASVYGSINDIRTIEQTTLIYGMFKLLASADVLSDSNGQLTLGSNAETFLRMSPVAQTSFLVDAYLNSAQIAEWSRIPEIKVKVEYVRHLKASRQTLFDHLAECPLLVWLPASELLHYVKRTSRNFLDKCVGDLLTYDDYHRGYFTGYYDWNNLEGRVIEVMLLEYLTALGLVETAINEAEDETGIPFFHVDYFRITRLGAHILGIEVSDGMVEVPTESDNAHSGFIVQPNFDIIISEGSSKQLHQLFFDRFAAMKADDVVTIYNIDFACIVKAVNDGITIRSIIDYIAEHSEYELPSNVVTTMQDWAAKSGKIRIRQATIVETDDELLLQELLHSKPIRKFVAGELNHAFEIDSSSATSVKREIEKRQYLCEYKK